MCVEAEETWFPNSYHPDGTLPANFVRKNVGADEESWCSPEKKQAGNLALACGVHGDERGSRIHDIRVHGHPRKRSNHKELEEQPRGIADFVNIDAQATEDKSTL
jgi:hypothetical protein